MLKRWLAALILTFSALPCVADYYNVPLLEPPPVTIPAGLSADDVGKEISYCAKLRGWQVKDSNPGMTVLFLQGDSYSATVQVSYDTSSLRISYVGSSGLGYDEEDGARTIHHNYNRWVNNLAHDLASEFTAYSMSR